MPRVVAITNQKGGVGKTTVALNLAACLALAGRMVLAVDLDPQGNLAQGLGVTPGASLLPHTLLHGEPLLSGYYPSGVTGLAVVPSVGLAMEGLEGQMSALLDGLESLRAALAPVPHDYVVIDCRPSLGPLTLAAMLAAELVIAPVEAGRYSLEGLANLLDTGRRLAQQQDWPGTVRLLVNRFNPRRVVSEWLNTQMVQSGAPVLQTRLRQSEAVNQAAIIQQPVAVFAPRSTGAQDFRALAAEVEALWA